MARGEKAAAPTGLPSWDPQLASMWLKEGCEELRRSVIGHEPPVPDTDYKIVLFGAVQAGKSSFINTLRSAMIGKYQPMARNAPATRSVTKKYHQYFIELPRRDIILCDTKGFEVGAEEDQCLGLSMEEVEKILDGEIGYKDLQKYKSKTKTNLVAVVWDANYVVQPIVLKQLESVLEAAHDRMIECCVVVTKVDKCSEAVDKDLALVFTDHKVQRVIAEVSVHLAIEKCNILPVQNYHTGQIDDSVVVKYLGLHTLAKLMDMADITLKRHRRPEDHATRLRQSPWKDVHLYKRTIAIDTLRSLVLDATKRSGITNINMAVVGLRGSGKSQFINAILSALHGKAKHDAYVDKDQSRSITKTLKVYKAPFQLHMYDTMGLAAAEKKEKQMEKEETQIEKQDTKIQTLKAVVEGRIHEGTNFSNPLAAAGGRNPEGTVFRFMKRYLTKDRSPKLSDCMHVVVLVIDGSAFPTLRLDEQSLLKDTYRMIRNLDVPCVVAVSHLDKVCQHVQKSAEAMFRSDEIRSCVKKIQESDLGVPYTEVLPVLTFSDPMLEGPGSTEARDKLLLHSLHHVCDRAKDYIASQPRQRCSQPTVICMLRTFAVLVVVAAIVLALIRAH